MDQQTLIVCSGKDGDPEPFYHLEQRLRDIASFGNIAVVALFDCCRSRLPKTITSPKSIKGSFDMSFGGNIHLIFGCQPTEGVPAKNSAVVENFF